MRSKANGVCRPSPTWLMPSTGTHRPRPAGPPPSTSHSGRWSRGLSQTSLTVPTAAPAGVATGKPCQRCWAANSAMGPGLLELPVGVFDLDALLADLLGHVLLAHGG